MPDEKLSLPETAALIALMAEAREVTNPELKARYGIEIDKKVRERLNSAKLIEIGKKGQAYLHVLSDAGWARMAEEFQTGISIGHGSPRAIILALTTGLQGFLRHSGHSLADVFAPQEEPAPDMTSTPEPDRTHGGPAGIEARIRSAYGELAGEPGAWVSLARLRPLLGDVAKADVDAVLVHMNRLPDVNIVPESNQKILTESDRDAAVTIGDQDKHLIWVGR